MGTARRRLVPGGARPRAPAPVAPVRAQPGAPLLGLQRRAGNRAVVELVQRKVVKNAPTYVTRGGSLAKTMLEGLDKTELGLTIPSLNGVTFFGEGAAANELGQRAAPQIHAPEATAKDTKGEYANQRPNIRIPVLDEWAEETGEYEETTHPDDDRDRKAHDADRWLGWAETQPLNVFDWRVELPAPPPWREEGVSKAKLEVLVAEIARRAGQDVPPGMDGLRESATLVVTDPGGDPALEAHTKQHEHQHVGDHHGLIDEMFGPWDQYSADHATEATGVKGTNSNSVRGRFQTGGGFTPGAQRIVAEFGAEIARSGDEYHRTDEGSVPRITVGSVTPDTVTVHIEPRVRLGAGAIPPPKHRWGAKKIQG